MSAEDIWNNWQNFVEPREPGNELEGPELELRRAAEEWGRELAREHEMAQAADIAQLLAQLIQANLAQNQREVDRDAREVLAMAARAHEDGIHAQVARIEKASGDDKPKLRRWIRDIVTLNAGQPALSVAVAERTNRDNLADSVKVFLADPANAPRAGILWPALQANIENLLLGESYEEVLRSEHRFDFNMV